MSQSHSLLQRQQHGPNADHQAQRDDRDEDGADGCPGFVIRLSEFRMDLGGKERTGSGWKDLSLRRRCCVDSQFSGSADWKDGRHLSVS